MKKSRKAQWMLLLVLSVGYSANAYCNSHWAAFLKRPNNDTLVILESTIAARAQHCDWGSPANLDVTPTEKQDMQLFELINKGNEAAFRAALLVLKCLDGGELEDFYRSAGIFFEAQPHAFLQVIKEKAIPDSRLSDMLTMLPLDTVDDFERKIHMFENRIVILNNISESSLKKKSLFCLNKALKDVKEIHDRIKR